MSHHRLNCMPAQFATFRKIILWMVDDAEYGEFGREFVADEKWQSLTASRFAWNAFRAASDTWACKNETHPLESVKRDREVVAMLNDKASVVEVQERPVAAKPKQLAMFVDEG